MKKYLVVFLALILALAITAPVLACGEIVLKKAGVCKGTYDIRMKFKYNFPGGFLTFKNAQTGEAFRNPSLIQINQIQAISLELIHEGGFLDFILLERGRDWYDKCGHLVIQYAVCMPPNTVMQVIVTGDFGQYQLAVDDPDLFEGIGEVFTFGKGCGFLQLSDGTWGITCR